MAKTKPPDCITTGSGLRLQFSGARLRKIGEQFGLSDAAVTQASRRMRVASENDEALMKQLDEIEVKLKLSVVET